MAVSSTPTSYWVSSGGKTTYYTPPSSSSSSGSSSGSRSGGSSGGSSSSGLISSSTGLTRDSSGNVYNASGQKLSLSDFAKNSSGNPVVNLTTLPTRTVSSGGSAPSSQTSYGGGSSYSGSSIVDYLNSAGQKSDFATRAQLAAQAGISNYTGTASQNTQLLNAIRSGSSGAGAGPSAPNVPSIAPSTFGKTTYAAPKPTVTQYQTWQSTGLQPNMSVAGPNGEALSVYRDSATGKTYILTPTASSVSGVKYSISGEWRAPVASTQQSGFGPGQHITIPGQPIPPPNQTQVPQYQASGTGPGYQKTGPGYQMPATFSQAKTITNPASFFLTSSAPYSSGLMSSVNQQQNFSSSPNYSSQYSGGYTPTTTTTVGPTSQLQPQGTDYYELLKNQYTSMPLSLQKAYGMTPEDRFMRTPNQYGDYTIVDKSTGEEVPFSVLKSIGLNISAIPMMGSPSTNAAGQDAFAATVAGYAASGEGPGYQRTPVGYQVPPELGGPDFGKTPAPKVTDVGTAGDLQNRLYEEALKRKLEEQPLPEPMPEDIVIDPGITEFEEDKFVVKESPYAEVQKQIDEIRNQLNMKNPFLANTFTEKQIELVKEAGGEEIQKRLAQKRADLTTAYGIYDNLTREVQNNKNFGQKMKARKLQFLDDKKQVAINTLLREVNDLETSLSDIQKNVAQQMDNYYKDYTVWENNRQALQTQLDKMQLNIDKATDNARAAIFNLVQNPELAKGLTNAEIQFIYDNGTYPASLIKKIGTAVNNEFQNIAQVNPTANTTQFIGITKDGRQVLIGDPVTDIRSSGSGDRTPSPGLSESIARYQNAIAAVQNDTNLSYADKVAQIGSLIGEIQTQYGGNSVDLGIIRDTFANSGSVTTSLSGSISEATQAEFDADLASELKTVSGLTGKAEKAKRAQDRLLGKYPSKTSTIKAAFSKWL